MKKVCTQCSKEKEATLEFFRAYHNKSMLRAQCRACDGERTKLYFRTEKGLAYKKKVHKRLQEQRPELLLYWSCKSGAKKRSLEFTLKEEDIVIPDVCPVLGIPLFLAGGKRTDNSPSVDRVDSSKGYTKDNVRVISWRANKLKQDASLEEVEKIAVYMKQHVANTLS